MVTVANDNSLNFHAWSRREASRVWRRRCDFRTEEPRGFDQGKTRLTCFVVAIESDTKEHTVTTRVARRRGVSNCSVRLQQAPTTNHTVCCHT